MKLRKSKTPTNVRFDEATNELLVACSQRFSMPVRELIRRAVAAKLAEWKKTGIVIKGK